MKRRNFLVAAGAALVAGCNRIAETNAGKAVLDAADSWHKNAQRLLTSRDALAPEYPASAISPFFRGNGSTDPQNRTAESLQICGRGRAPLRRSGSRSVGMAPT